MVEGIGRLSGKKNHFCPQNDNFGAVLTGRSLGTRILRLNRKTKLTQTVQNLSKNSRSDQGGGRSHNRLP